MGYYTPHCALGPSECRACSERKEMHENHDSGIPQERNSADPAKRRLDGRFGKGNSANPGGQPKWMKETRESLRRMLPGSAERLEGIIRDGEDKDSVAAIRLLFDFTLPKPTQKHKVTGKVENPLAGMTTEQLLEWGRNLKEAKKEDK